MIDFACKSVLGGWQTIVRIGEYEALIGPVFNKSTDLWAWQKDNLPKETP